MGDWIILRKHKKTILLILSIIIILAPWIFFGRNTQDGYWSISSKSFRSIVGTNHTEAIQDETVYIDEGFDFLFMTGDDGAYIKISPENIPALEQALFTDATWTLPPDMALVNNSLNISSKMISWGDNSIIDALSEEAETLTASGLSLDIQASVYISDTAALGENVIILNLPQLPEIEAQLSAEAIFPNDDIRLNSTQINGQIINIHDTATKKIIADKGRWVLTFIGIALFLFSLLFFVSETDDD